MDPTRQLAYLLERLVELLTRAVQQAPRLAGVRAQLLSGHPEGERQRDEPLLGAVVEVTLQPPALAQAERAHRLGHRAPSPYVVESSHWSNVGPARTAPGPGSRAPDA